MTVTTTTARDIIRLTLECGVKMKTTIIIIALLWVATALFILPPRPNKKAVEAPTVELEAKEEEEFLTALQIEALQFIHGDEERREVVRVSIEKMSQDLDIAVKDIEKYEARQVLTMAALTNV